MKGMILVAGEGTRARPLTEHIAKPALPIPGGTIITHLIRQIQYAGIEEIALNLHYKPETIMAALEAGQLSNVRIVPFDEPVLAGSGGGFHRIREFFGDKPFLIMNGDSIATADLKDMIAFHNTHSRPFTFLVRKDSSASVRVIDADRDGDVIAIRKQPKPPGSSHSWQFCGAMVIDPAAFHFFPKEEVIDLFDDALIPALENGEKVGKIFAPDSFTWLDFGTPEDYRKNCFRYLNSIFPTTEISETFRKPENYFIDKTARVDSTLNIAGFSYIGEGCTLTGNGKIENSIIFSSTCTISGEVKDSIVYSKTGELTEDYKDSIISDLF